VTSARSASTIDNDGGSNGGEGGEEAARGRGRRSERHGHGILAKKARTGYSRVRPNVSGDRPTDRAAFRSSAPHFTLHRLRHTCTRWQHRERLLGSRVRRRRLASSRRSVATATAAAQPALEVAAASFTRIHASLLSFNGKLLERAAERRSLRRLRAVECAAMSTFFVIRSLSETSEIKAKSWGIKKRSLV